MADVSWALKLLPIWAAKSGVRVQQAVSAVICELETRSALVVSLSEEVQMLCAKDSEGKPKTVSLSGCMGVIEAINDACTCGGDGPEHGCPACQVYHAIKDMEFKI
jgi:hypothetical protein